MSRATSSSSSALALSALLLATATAQPSSSPSSSASPVGICPTCWQNGLGTYPACAGGSATAANCSGWPFGSQSLCPGQWYDQSHNLRGGFPCGAGTTTGSGCGGTYRSYNAGCGDGNVYWCCVCPPGTGDTGSACVACLCAWRFKRSN